MNEILQFLRCEVLIKLHIKSKSSCFKTFSDPRQKCLTLRLKDDKLCEYFFKYYDKVLS